MPAVSVPHRAAGARIASGAGPVSVILGVIVGLVLGLTGAGGSVFAVPLLVFGLGWTMTQAVPVALIAVCAAAAMGTLAAWNVAYVRYRAAMLMALASCATAPLGLRIADHMPESRLTIAFCAVMLVVAARLLIQARSAPAETRIVRSALSGDGAPARGPLCGLHAQTGRLVWTNTCALAISGIGAVTGLLSGALGVGGGFVIVPSLRASTALSMHSAIATSLMAIALMSAITVIASVAMGHHLPWAVALPFVLGSVGGMVLGRRLAPRLAGPLLQQGFAVTMIVAAGLIIAREARA